MEPTKSKPQVPEWKTRKRDREAEQRRAKLKKLPANGHCLTGEDDFDDTGYASFATGNRWEAGN